MIDVFARDINSLRETGFKEEHYGHFPVYAFLYGAKCTENIKLQINMVALNEEKPTPILSNLDFICYPNEYWDDV